MNQKNNIMNLNRLYLCILVCLMSGFAYALPRTYTVTSVSLNYSSLSALDGALYDAMNFNSISGNQNTDIIIYLKAPGLIHLSERMYPVTLVAGTCNFSIMPHPLADVTQGFDMQNFSTMPVGTSWIHPWYGLSFLNCANASVTVINIVFNDFNKAVSTFMYNNINNTSIPSTFFAQFGGLCSSWPTYGITASSVTKLIVSGCQFINYVYGVSYGKVNDLRILGNIFSTDNMYSTYPGCVADGSTFAVVNENEGINTILCKSEIASNTVTAQHEHAGTGIVINPYPFNTPGVDQSGLNVNANIDFRIHDNIIKNSAYGISQGCMLPNRTSPDVTYSLSITSNTVENTVNNVSFGAPYKHFSMLNNKFKLTSRLPNYFPNTDIFPFYLSFGSYTIVTVPSTPGGVTSIMTPYNNKFGFDMIYPGNSLGLTPKNHTNTFQFINNPSYSWDPSINTIGDFGDNTNTTPPGLNFINMNLNGWFQVLSGKNTNIRECKNSLNGEYVGVGIPDAYPGPIALYGNLWSDNTFSTFTYGNHNISAPTLQEARVQTGQLKVSLTLTGNEIVPANGKFTLEFFKSNIKGELVTFINKQDVITLTGGVYQYAITPVSGVTVTAGDRIGVTLTSIGDNASSTNPAPLGTSTVSYIYTLPACSDCLSDFAPIPGKDYIVSCWVAFGGVGNYTTYEDPNSIGIKFTSYSSITPLTVLGSPISFNPSGPMIDNWQKIEARITIPAAAAAIKLEVDRKLSTWVIDDFRFYPVDATVKTYAYDPASLRLMAELDEQNYATIYEYDDDGQLIRVKKETEKGIMTVKESRNNKPVK